MYPDSKTFVDKKLLYPEQVVIDRYNQMKNQTPNPSTNQLKTFIDQNFADDHQESWEPPDFKLYPQLIKSISDPVFQKFALNLNQIWKELGQKVKDEVRLNPDRHTILYMPNGFIKVRLIAFYALRKECRFPILFIYLGTFFFVFSPQAGGRFREMYYWDSYWIVRGLLLSDMYDTARGIVENMLYLVRTYGYMPNGNRKYYLQRSQPPLLIQMAATYHSVTKDNQFIFDNLRVSVLKPCFCKRNYLT